MKHISVSAAMDSPELFEPFFRGPTWNMWRSIVKAAFCEPLTTKERALFYSVSGDRDPPKKPIKELVALAGRGSGKDSIVSLICTVLALNFNPKGRVRPGEKVLVACLATDRDQATIVLSYIQAYFEEIPALKALVINTGKDSIELRNGVLIRVTTNSYKAVRGRSLLAAVFDECCFWADENSARPDVETHAAVTPGLARVKGSMLFMISSVHKRAGLAYQRWQRHYGKDLNDVLCVLGSTMQFNPGFDEALIEAAIEENPDKYNAEYNSIWRDDLSSYVDADLLQAALDPGCIVRPPLAGPEYIASCDVSGGRGSNFAIAIAHAERGGIVILDMCREYKSPFNPSIVVTEVAQLLKEYGITSICGDNYGANWVVESFSKCGIKYIKSERDRSAIYQDCLPLFTSGRVRLVDDRKLIAQFASLEKRTFGTGRVRVDPGPSGDDVCNAAALALTLVGCESAPTLIKYHDFFVHGAPLPDSWDARVSGHYVYFFSVAVDASGKCAIISWAGSRFLQPNLVLRDFQTGYFTEQRFTPHARLLALCYSAASSRRVAAVVEGLYEANDRDVITEFGFASVAAAYVAGGAVKITQSAHVKSAGSPLGDALDFRHDRLQDPLPVAAICGVYRGLHEEQ